MVFKRLTEPNHDVRAQFDALNAFLAARLNGARDQLVSSTAWPLQLVLDGGIPIGFVMRRAPEQYRILVTGPLGQRKMSGGHVVPGQRRALPAESRHLATAEPGRPGCRPR